MQKRKYALPMAVGQSRVTKSEGTLTPKPVPRLVDPKEALAAKLADPNKSFPVTVKVIQPRALLAPRVVEPMKGWLQIPKAFRVYPIPHAFRMPAEC